MNLAAQTEELVQKELVLAAAEEMTGLADQMKKAVNSWSGVDAKRVTFVTAGRTETVLGASLKKIAVVVVLTRVRWTKLIAAMADP
jgi:hypothetical protein